MQDPGYVPFTKEMKATHTILAPNMLPMHFELVAKVFRTWGYRMEILKDSGPEVIETGLKYTHNDACYPALCVIGQFIHALQSGRYDPDRTALVMFQTGGGCRASNYISLIRKALKRANLAHVPVISFSFVSLEKHPGFRLTLPIIRSLSYAVLFGDLLMSLKNQVLPYETEPGSCQRMIDRWMTRLTEGLGSGGHMFYPRMKRWYREILADFASIPRRSEKKVQVGIVGEIYVKYSPLANNRLEELLMREGAEVNMPGLLDFLLYCVYNVLVSHRLYGTGTVSWLAMRGAYRLLCGLKHSMIRMMKEEGHFRPWTPFEEITSLAEEFISPAVKMGEGWLLTAEMLELGRSGCKNIVCAQPFGCLPNHICGKGMMKPIKERYPDMNIVAVDYDPGASPVNQENRIKLMLVNARAALAAEESEASE